jgi:hypothetical protein
VPVTSLLEEYAVVAAFTVAEVRYKAALNVSAVEAARIGEAPKLWVAVNTSPKKEVVSACVFAMIFPLSY